MVKNILQLFFVCSLLLQAQSAKIDLATSQKSTHTKKSTNHNATSTSAITSPSYMIKPLSTIYSSLPSDLYISHTFTPKSKEKRALTETSSVAQANSTIINNFSESAKPPPTTSTSTVASSSLSIVSTTTSEKASSLTAPSANSTTEPNSTTLNVELNNINSTIQTTSASPSIDTSKAAFAAFAESSNSSITPSTAATTTEPITTTTSAPTTTTTTNLTVSITSTPTTTTTSIAPTTTTTLTTEATANKSAITEKTTETATPTSSGYSSSEEIIQEKISIQSASSSIEHYTIPTFRPVINEDILKAMPSKSFILKRPNLPSHSASERYANHNHKHSVSAILRPVSSNAPIHAAQNHNSLLSLIPSILNTPQQIDQQMSSSTNEASPSLTDIAAQQITDAPNGALTNDTQRVYTTVIAKELSNPEAHIKSCYRKGRKVEFSQYWIPKENEWDETNRGKRVFLGGDAKMKLYDRFDKEIGQVPVDMYQKCRMEGTCLLENGDLINIESNDTDTFIKIGGPGRKENVFGLGSGPQNLVPFISVAANDIPYGQKLYISALDGMDLGNGMKHNGCVRVDDESWSFDSCQIDFFVLTYVDYLWLDLDTKVSIKYADCKLKNYVTKDHLIFVKAGTDRAIIPNLLDAKSTFFIDRKPL